MILKKALYILKRDFRLRDNPALTAAVEENDEILAVFILEPSFLSAHETSIFHVEAIHSAFGDLKNQIESRGGVLHILQGEYLDILQKIRGKFDFKAIYAHEEIGLQRTYQRDIKLAQWCRKNEVDFKEYRQTGVFRALKDRDKRNTRWAEFTFGELLKMPHALQKLVAPPGLASDEFPAREELQNAYPNLFRNVDPHYALAPVGETAAWDSMASFTSHRGMGYSKKISSPNTALVHGSRLSVHLAWGSMTGRTVYREVNEAIANYRELKEQGNAHAGKMAASLRSFVSRMHWRDHFMQRLESDPMMETRALNPAYNALEYEDNPEFLQAFRNGLTGFPMVDACIRCLRATGFINFRMRAMLTSFACHTLHMDWRALHPILANWFVDFEPGIHLSQIQMQAGVVGINTLRTYNPTKQLADHDAETVFVKKWIPELRDFAPEEILKHGSAPLGTYPAHIVDWRERSGLMRKRVYDIRKTEGYAEVAGKVYAKHGSRKRPAKSKKTPKKAAQTNQIKMEFE